MGGESHRANLSRFPGYSAKAQCTGNPPHSGSLQKTIEGRSVLARKQPNSMQKPDGIAAYLKGRGSQSQSTASLISSNYLKRGYRLFRATVPRAFKQINHHLEGFGAADRTRTYDRLVNSQPLYLAELRRHSKALPTFSSTKLFKDNHSPQNAYAICRTFRLAIPAKPL
jgi:hypothetical protein